MDFPVIYNTTQLIQWLVAEKIPYEILGFTAMGDPVVMAHKDGEGRPVLVTAGAHAVEPAGVSAALMLLKNWDKPYPLYVIPLRDPLGSQGYAPILAKALGHKVEFHCHEELSRILLDNATEVFVNSDAFVLVKIGETLFVSTHYVEEEAGPRQSEIFVDQFLQEHPEVLPALAGRRIVCPANFGEESETVGLYERAFTAEISNYGVFVDMNRRFGCADAAIEVKITQQVCDQLHPQLVIDMHEGFGSSYYFFFADYDTSPKLRKLAALMDARMSDYGEPTRLSTITSAIPSAALQYKEPLPGIIVDRAGNHLPGLELQPFTAARGGGFSTYASRYCPAFTVESGAKTTMARRVEVHLRCAEVSVSALSSIED